MTDILQVKDNKDLVRQAKSSAILNTNTTELHKYKQIRDEKIKLLTVVEEQKKIKSDVEEIKSLLKQLIGQNK
jgi:hypothetical protein